MNRKIGFRLIALTVTLMLISIPLNAAEFNFNLMNLSNYVSSNIHNLDNWGSNVNERQANAIMNYLLTSGERYGYYRITLSSQYIGRGKKDKGITIWYIIAGTFTAGLTMPVIPIGQSRYELKAVVEFFDVNKNFILGYPRSTFFDGWDKLSGTEDYTWKTEDLFRSLLKECLTAASRDAEKINSALRMAKYPPPPPPPPVETVIETAYGELSRKIPAGSSIAVLDVNNDYLLLARQIEARFLKAGKYQVIERARIDAIINEIVLSQSVFVDVNDPIEVGRLVSANYIVLGNVSGSPGAVNSLSFRIVLVPTGEVVANFTGAFKDNFFKAAN